MAAPIEGGISDGAIGRFLVLDNILSSDILWESIRQKCGAYGAGFSLLPSSHALVGHTYRDPIAPESIRVLLSLPSLIREFANHAECLDEYIIGAIGEVEGLSTLQRDARIFDGYYLSRKSEESLKRTRAAMLCFDKEALLDCARVIEIAFADARIAAVASEDTLSKIPSLDKIYRL